MGAIERYIDFEMRTVEGWLERYAAKLIAVISEVQRQERVIGAVGEIGVHHGKLFVLLLLTAAPCERAFAIDVFDEQKLNVDGSGRGDREKFLENVQLFSRRQGDVLIIGKSSLETKPCDILAKMGQSRLISIDGGHTAECTKNDLRLAEAIMNDRGVAILDDYFNPSWPDVATGAAEHFLDPRTTLRPFAIGPNKLFLSAQSSHNYYRKALRGRFRPEKVSRMFGMEVDLYGCEVPSPTVGNLIRLGIKESALGPYAVAANALLKRLLRTGPRMS